MKLWQVIHLLLSLIAIPASSCKRFHWLSLHSGRPKRVEAGPAINVTNLSAPNLAHQESIQLIVDRISFFDRLENFISWMDSWYAKLGAERFVTFMAG